MPGGVCAHLDYDVEVMADYIAEMATRLVMPGKAINTAFRKFVAQILSSTRLPRTTILLGMNYLSKRMAKLGTSSSNGEGYIWRMLTVALLLGSKFLDDNTFQNKSWSDVSGIPVRELNTMEYEWLGSIKWCLYVNLDMSQDYKAWLDNWDQWLEEKKQQQQQQQRERERDRLAALTPIDTELARAGVVTWHQQQVAEYNRLSSVKQNQAPTQPAYRRDQPASWTYWPRSAPLTPPDSGYGTPEYVNSATSANSHYQEWFDRAICGGPNVSRHYQPPVAYNSFQQGGHASRNTPNYGTTFYNYGHSIWDHPYVQDCNCATCLGAHAKPPAYFVSHTYGQPVVG